MRNCLIIDDSRVIRRASREMLEELGFNVDEAVNGLEGLAHCRAQMLDVILLDWNMPIMSGIEFLIELRQSPGGDYPKIIFCTTESSPSHFREAIDAGADEYIVKPFDHETLRVKLQLVGIS